MKVEDNRLKNVFSKIKLKWKIFGFLLGFCFLLLVILWLFQVTLLDEFYTRIRIAETRNDIAFIFEHLYDDDIQEIVDEISEAGDFSVDIVDFNGRSLLSHTRPNSREETENLNMINIARTHGGDFYWFDRARPHRSYSNRRSQNRRSNNRSPVESLVYVRLAEDRAIIVNSVVSPVFATTTTLRYQLYAISGIMIILSAALAIIIAKRISKPIEKINASARDLAKGKYDTRFNGKGFSEIVGLSETLNTAAAELGSTEALRRELLANVSHDLRTPISLIYSYAEMMHDFPDDITPEQTEVIMQETERLTGILNDVLDISKLEAGVDKLNISGFDLTKKIGTIISRMRELLVNQNYSIEFNHNDEVMIEADEQKIDRAFYNLLVNAVNFAGEDKKVIVDLNKTDTGVKVSVTDHGEGISEDELPFIWDRYYKSGKTHKRPVTGTGLGLSIVKKIIDLHGGSYGVESEVCKGSTFWFELDK